MRPLQFVPVLSFALFACNGSIDGGGAPVGSAVARITQVPPKVGCVSITAAGTRTVTDSFDVTPGQSATMTLSNLPVGSDAFTAAAYATPCASIAGAQPNWSSTAPFFATISAGSTTSLALTLEPTGGAVVGINFDGDGGVPVGDGGIPVDGGLPSDLAFSTDLAQPHDLAQPPHDLAQP